ncbi:MAG: hypothetical protein RL684_3239 [Pseudomonadota bacterium]|jgi:hypothetical protein|nr:hypothetical protein [Rhodanobacteraceae bacterium]
MKGSITCGALALLGIFVCATPAVAGKNDSDITLKNKSRWAIHELYLSSTGDREWGDDQLGRHTINTGDSFTLTGIPCDKYDVRLVDEDGDECVVENVAICADSESWKITDHDLLGCQAATEQ